MLVRIQHFPKTDSESIQTILGLIRRKTTYFNNLIAGSSLKYWVTENSDLS